MNDFAKVKDYKGLVRDMRTKAILNTDHEALINHRKNKNALKNMMNNSQKISKIEEEIDDIKKMLLILIEKNKV
jgi:hypothetical protein